MLTKAVVACVILLAATAAEARNVCRDAGLKGVPLLNCSLDRYLHCPAGRVKATLDTNEGVACEWVKKGNGVYGAASLEYACGTHLLVRHGSREAHIVINDKGPYSKAKIDLSYQAGAALGMGTNSGCVEIARYGGLQAMGNGVKRN